MNLEDRWVGAYILDEHGNAMPERDIMAWSKWFGSHDRHVALTGFPWGEVSTVFLGLDHSFNHDPMGSPLDYRPVLWETLVFGGALDMRMARYTSREDALAGHRLAVEACKQAHADAEDRISVEIIV